MATYANKTENAVLWYISLSDKTTMTTDEAILELVNQAISPLLNTRGARISQKLSEQANLRRQIDEIQVELKKYNFGLLPADSAQETLLTQRLNDYKAQLTALQAKDPTQQ